MSSPQSQDPDLYSHLSDEQFAEAATEHSPARLDPAIAEHLAACAACRAELDDFRASMESFNTKSLAWSEAQPAESLRPRVRGPKREPAWAVASWALAGSVALVSALSIATHRPESRPAAELPAAQAEDSAGQIERDNKLLLAVYEATSARASSPLQEYGLEAPSDMHVKARHLRNSHD